MIFEKNFAFVPVEQIPVDTHYERCNFTREPDTSGAQPVGIRLFPGDDTPRTFVQCNLVNCIPPPGSTLIQCNTALVGRGLPLGELFVVTVDGVEVYRRQGAITRIYARALEPDLVSYNYLPVPEDVLEPRR